MKTLLTLLITALLATSGRALEDDRLILVGASYGKNVLALTDTTGEVLWKYETEGLEKGHSGHHDVQFLPNGNLLYHDSWTVTREITLDQEIVWEYDSATANGNTGKKANVHAFTRLPNGDTVIVESGVGRIIHVDAEGQLKKSIPLGEDGRKNTRLMRLLDSGHYLVCAENPGLVTEYSTDGQIVWEYPTNTRVFGAIRLANGNTLIATGSGNSVIEVTPEKEVVWQIEKSIPGTEIELAWTTVLQELPNGHRLIGNCHAENDDPQIFEITPEKEIVWEFNEWDLVGNGLACWQVLDADQSAMIRAKLKK